MGRLVQLAVWPLVVHFTMGSSVRSRLNCYANSSNLRNLGNLGRIAHAYRLSPMGGVDQGISSSTAKTNFVVTGALIAVLALYEIWTARRQSG
jgi:hypothetical protein